MTTMQEALDALDRLYMHLSPESDLAARHLLDDYIRDAELLRQESERLCAEIAERKAYLAIAPRAVDVYALRQEEIDDDFTPPLPVSATEHPDGRIDATYLGGTTGAWQSFGKFAAEHVVDESRLPTCPQCGQVVAPIA